MLSVEAVNRAFSRRLSLNRAILKSPYWVLPVDDVGHNNFMPVGRGLRSSVVCGRWIGFSVCKNVAEHNGVSVGGVDCTGKVVVRHRHMWCHKSSCPVCFIRGWSVRGARSVEGRLIEAVNRGFGDVEHILVSVPVVDYDLSESVLRAKCRKALFDRGVIGGCMIFHGYRVDKKRGVLVWSPHYHVLGFVVCGYARCRECERKWNCLKGCGDFDDRAWQGFQKDKYFVKVFKKRKTVFGTAFYQLNHATIRVGIVRFHAVTWFGSCGNCKFKSANVDVEVLCPACESVMVKSVYMGKRHIVKNVGHVDYVPLFVFDEFDENGEPNFIDVVGSRGG